MRYFSLLKTKIQKKIQGVGDFGSFLYRTGKINGCMLIS